MALALGLKTCKLKFGHHGGNHPVVDLSTRKVEITTQNHSFAVEPDGDVSNTPFGKVEVSHLNLNDKSVEGLVCRDIPAFSVQHHPEASPGPRDAGHMFEKFLEMVRQSKQ
jgi:carbamoyl-phosphate synthase small subunit